MLLTSSFTSARVWLPAGRAATVPDFTQAGSFIPDRYTDWTHKRHDAGVASWRRGVFYLLSCRS
jgi:hypothetical protein